MSHPGKAPTSVSPEVLCPLHVPNVLCGLHNQAPQSTKSPNRSSILFLVPRITLRTFNATLFTTPDNYNTHIYNSRYSPDESHKLFMTMTFYIRSLQAPETNCLMFRVTASPATSLGGNSQRREVARQPESTHSRPQLQITHPRHCEP